MTDTRPTVCVIIPYYQTTPEPLIRAIRSILAQEGVARPLVLIVDDGSPAPARNILDENFPGHEPYIRLIEQQNAGAATARNTGLNKVPESVSYIAFLDSDDAWTSGHLSNALRMMVSGCDFYFAGYQRIEWDNNTLARKNLLLGAHKCIDETAGLYEYAGEILRPVLNDHLISTPTVVFRRSLMKDIFFPIDLILGEDEVFWVQALRRARKIGFCTRTGATETQKGVGVSQGGDWGSERSFQLMAQNIHYWKRVSYLLPDETELNELQNVKIKQLRRNLAESVWHNLRRRHGLPLRHIARFTLSDPAWLLSLRTVLLNRLTRKHHE